MICPEVGCIIPASIRIKVVFPAPLAPSSPQTPGVRLKEMSSTAVMSLKRFEICSMHKSIMCILSDYLHFCVSAVVEEVVKLMTAKGNQQGA